LPTASVVYGSVNSLEKPCIQLEPLLDKKRVAHKKVVSAHLILWIFSGLSTDETDFLPSQGVWDEWMGFDFSSVAVWLSQVPVAFIFSQDGNVRDADRIGHFGT
jgi:hypothetical protein